MLGTSQEETTKMGAIEVAGGESGGDRDGDDNDDPKKKKESIPMDNLHEGWLL